MTEELNEREDPSMPTPFTDRVHRRDEEHPWRIFLAIVGVVAMLAFVVVVTAVSAHVARVSTTAAQKIEQGIQNSHYSGRCGRGTFNRCRYAWRPSVIRHDPHSGWWRFINGYYEEWRPTLRGPRLYACKLTGWAYPGRPIALDYNHCWRK